MKTVLLSGGLDSAVCLAMHVDTTALAVFVDYGQPAVVQERAAVSKLAAHYDVMLQECAVLVPWYSSGAAMLLPGRNLILLALAAAAGEYADAIVIGANADDQAGYADCRPGFLAAASSAVGVPVLAPLIGMTKAEIGWKARDLVVPDVTWSCYYPSAGDPCGECDACVARGRAFALERETT